MKIILAPDSFKGSLSAAKAAQILEVACKKVFGKVQTIQMPIADGGEGTTEAFVMATFGGYGECEVTGPLNSSVKARYGMIGGGKTAVIEMAQASGLPLVPVFMRDPMKTTSKGTGELIEHVLMQGADEIIIGIGGSATNDGAMGMLAALGAKFYDEAGEELFGCGKNLIKVRHIDLSEMDEKLKDIKITVICDVNNPLLGENGATYIYGRQKGADDLALLQLEEGMENYANVFLSEHGIDIACFSGAGAAGGMGGALKGILKADLKPGIDAVLDALRFEEELKTADLVVTGEGFLDAQSVKYGKAVAGIAKRCAEHGMPLAIITGGMGEGAEAIYDIADAAIITTINAPMEIGKAMENAEPLFMDASERLFRSIKIGMEIEKRMK